jgi:hypothetical protein
VTAEPRCRHDLVPGQCAPCRGLRDWAVEKLTESELNYRVHDESEHDLPLAVESPVRCSFCERGIEEGETLTETRNGYLKCDRHF